MNPPTEPGDRIPTKLEALVQLLVNTWRHAQVENSRKPVKATANQPTKSQEHYMNAHMFAGSLTGNIAGGNITTSAYKASQSALQPVAESLQVEESLQSLLEVVEFHTETVLALMRRLEPVTGELVFADQGLSTGIAKVSLALRIDTQRDNIAKATAGLQATIRALQI
jgi:hypothetical protein